MGHQKYDEMSLSHLIGQIATGLLNAQVDLDAYGLETEELLAETTFPANTIPVAVVEFVDDKGKIVHVETLMNQAPVSLADMGMTPVFLEICDTEAALEFMLHIRDSEAPDGADESWQPSAVAMHANLSKTAGFRELFALPGAEVGFGAPWRNGYRLAAASSTAAAIRSKASHSHISSHIRFTIRPKTSTDL
ncbi:MAG: hypothetical protein P8184_19620 [Calditrichia bacterium]